MTYPITILTNYLWDVCNGNNIAYCKTNQDPPSILLYQTCHKTCILLNVSFFFLWSYYLLLTHHFSSFPYFPYGFGRHVFHIYYIVFIKNIQGYSKLWFKESISCFLNYLDIIHQRLNIIKIIISNHHFKPSFQITINNSVCFRVIHKTVIIKLFLEIHWKPG